MSRLGRPKMTAPPLEQVRAMLPIDDINRIEILAKQRGVTTSVVYREAVAAYLQERS